MNTLGLLTIFVFVLSTCGQQQNINTTQQMTNKTEEKMDLSKISNENVRKAMEALQAHDKQSWFVHFTDDVTFTDDGQTMDFHSFFDNAINHKEKFLDIDRIDNEGRDIYGNFFAGQWGTFRVYFKFHQKADGQFHQLDIGQVSKLPK